MNFKLFTTLLLSCGIATISIAQCPTTYIILDSQAAIDNFAANYPGCTEILSSLWIEEEQEGSIINLDGLSQLTSVGGHLRIQNNPNLNNLDGLSQLTSVGEDLAIQWNSELSQCCSLCPLLTADKADPTVIGGSITIEDNHTYGCNSETEILTCYPCGLGGKTSEFPTKLTIYPNPTQNNLHFQYESIEDELIEVTIKSQLGQQIFQGQFYTNQPAMIDISEYPAGVYIFNVLQQEQSLSQLFGVSK